MTVAYDDADFGVERFQIVPDAIVARALNADADATFAILASILPKAQARVGIAYRDLLIRHVACWLAEAMPGSKRATVARVITEAGDSLQRGRGISARYPFHLLSADERDRLESEVKNILACSARWPKQRQMFSIVRP